MKRPQETKTAIDTSEGYYELLKEYHKQTMELHPQVKETFLHMKADLEKFRENVIKIFQDSWKSSLKKKIDQESEGVGGKLRNVKMVAEKTNSVVFEHFENKLEKIPVWETYIQENCLKLFA